MQNKFKYKISLITIFLLLFLNTNVFANDFADYNNQGIKNGKVAFVSPKGHNTYYDKTFTKQGNYKIYLYEVSSPETILVDVGNEYGKRSLQYGQYR